MFCRCELTVPFNWVKPVEIMAEGQSLLLLPAVSNFKPLVLPTGQPFVLGRA